MSGDGTIGKALDVLDQVASFDRPVRFSELLDKSPYPKATLYRHLQALTSQGMLALDPDRQTYALGIRLVRLAHAAWNHSSLAPVARPHLESLSNKVGETVHLAQLDNGQVLYVDKRNATRPIEMYSEAGKVGPAYCTGVGKAMLAFLDEAEARRQICLQSFHQFTPQTLTGPDALLAELEQIRTTGHAFDKEEHEPGIICVALPILTRTGRVLGALSVTSSTDRTSLSALAGLVPIIRPVSEQIAADAEDWRFPDQSTQILLAGG